MSTRQNGAVSAHKVITRPAEPPRQYGLGGNRHKKDAPPPTACKRLGCCVVVEQYHPRELLTVAEARRLAAELIEAAKLADLTPLASRTGCTRRIPGDTEEGATDGTGEQDH